MYTMTLHEQRCAIYTPVQIKNKAANKLNWRLFKMYQNLPYPAIPRPLPVEPL